ncbi:hypothetical protein MASR2M78_13790 [Treponema sp.]
MNKAYQCKECGKELVQDSTKKAPDCCGETMKEISLESCRDAGPEAARFSDANEPCEDFTGNQ